MPDFQEGELAKTVLCRPFLQTICLAWPDTMGS